VGLSLGCVARGMFCKLLRGVWLPSILLPAGLSPVGALYPIWLGQTDINGSGVDPGLSLSCLCVSFVHTPGLTQDLGMWWKAPDWLGPSAPGNILITGLESFGECVSGSGLREPGWAGAQACVAVICPLWFHPLSHVPSLPPAPVPGGAPNLGFVPLVCVDLLFFTGVEVSACFSAHLSCLALASVWTSLYPHGLWTPWTCL
jgi:hypothetical protein